MKQTNPKLDPRTRRGIRRTAWILAGVVVAIFALSLIEAALSR